MLLGGKFAKPIASRGYVHCELITNKLKSSLTLIKAAAGCLLTESLVNILEEDGGQVVWLRFGWEDFDPATCLISLVEALQVISEKVGAAILEKMRKLPGSLQGWPGLFAQLGHEIKECQTESLILVLENMDYPARLLQTVTLLGKHFLPALPEEARVILISQKNLPRYSLQKPPEIIETQDLLLSATAIRRLFQDAELNSEKECQRQAVRVMHGSPVGLAGLCRAGELLGETYVQDVLQRQTTRAGLFTQIARDWLGTLDEGDIQATGTLLSLGYNHPDIHLLQTGRPALTPSPWAQQLDRGWVRPHTLWLSSIEAALRTSLAFRRQSIQTTAEYLCRSGSLIPGIDLLFSSGAENLAAKYLVQNVDEMLSLGQWELLKTWLAVLPDTVLADHPRLLHAAGDIKCTQGDLGGAAQDYQRASEQYLREDDLAGHVSSLLALSTLAACRGEVGEAWSSASRALQLAQSLKLPRHESRAEFQISLLTLRAGDIKNAIEHLVLARERARIAGDARLLKCINDLHALVLEQDQCRQQSQQEHQRFLDAQQAERAHLERLQGAIQAPLELVDPAWISLGWLQTPLMLEAAAEISTNEQSPIGRKNLWRKIRVWLRRGLENVDPQKTKTHSTKRPENPERWLPARLDQSHAEKKAVYPSNPEVNYQPVESEVELKSNSESVRHTLDLSADGENLLLQDGPEAVPTLSAYMLGEFRLALEDVPVEQLHPGQISALLKYLIHNHKRRIPREELMEVFWPEVELESARNRLNVTLSKIRKALRNASNLEIILFESDKYFLNPELRVWVDVDQFENILAEARRLEVGGDSTQALRSLEVAANLYQGDFLTDDIYAEWTVLTREHLRLAYLEVLFQLSRHCFENQQYAACAAICQSILVRDNCREDVHCLLMRCYAQQGQVPLALRQYQICVQALQQELNVAPAASTVTLYEQLRRR